MLNFLTENVGTLVIGAAVAAVLVSIVVKLVRNKKKGASSCGCGCSSCPSSGMCHKK